VDVDAYAGDHSVSIEEAARILRYRYLFAQAEVKCASAVVVGHTADDQVETILMHLLRGSGLVGLQGMQVCTLPNPWSQHIPLVRPLLSTWRADIMAYLEQHAIHPAIDRSNLDPTYFRNRLRLELLPYLEGYNPGVRENLLRMGQLLQVDYGFISQQVEQAWQVCLVRHFQGCLAFRQSTFLAQPLSIQRYLLRRAIAYHFPSLRDIDFECIQRGLQFLSEGRSRGQVDLMVGLAIICERDLFWLVSSKTGLPAADFPALNRGEVLNLEVPGVLSLNGNWQIQAEEVTETRLASLQSLANTDRLQVWLDAAGLTLPLIVRSRKKGDRLQPLGMQGHSIKVSDLMINQKIPARARRAWPLVCSGDEIVWIPGCRQSRYASLIPNSQSVIHLSLVRSQTT
jgi:tRNA(Ile)-lysidine synthase